MRSDDDVVALDSQGTPRYFPGEDRPSFEVRANVFRATNGTFEESGAIDGEREHFVMAPLPGGEVLVTGGYNDKGTPSRARRIWKPKTGRWVEGALMHIARAGAVASPLDDGRVLVVGGSTPSGNDTSTAEIYDPAADSWVRVASKPSDGDATVAVTIANGDVVVAGGHEDGSFPVFRYRPSTDRWTSLDDLARARRNGNRAARRRRAVHGVDATGAAVASG